MVHEINNPIVKHKVAQLRNKNTAPKDFRALVDRIFATL